MAENDEHHPFIWFIEAFSVLGGLAFIISATVNAVAFAISWRINYFLVASPADVVMGSFITLGLSLIVAATMLVVVIVLAFWSDCIRQIESLEDPSFRNIVKVYKTSFGRLPKTTRLLTSLKTRKGNRVLISGIFSSVVMLLGVAVPISGPFWQETGLNVAEGVNVASTCRGAHVLWLGSSTAILDCQDGIRVIHKLDGLETVRRFR